jgi:outer membrane protein OmpA-like peptidoglycan-associated protein
MNKKYIYISAYLIAVSLCSIALYLLITRPESQPGKTEKIEVIPVVEKKEPRVIACFEDNRRHLDGLMRIIPAEALTDFFEQLTTECSSEICEELRDLNESARSYENMIQSLPENECLSQLYERSIEYHHSVLSKESVIGIFFDEGSAALSESHKYKLKVILNTYRVKASEYGLMVIGRASRGGNLDSNRRLSLQRVRSITGYVEGLMDGKLKTDFVYFGAERPRLDKELAELYHIPQEDYTKAFTSQPDENYEIRLNQSVLVVIYEKEDDPFQMDLN